MMICAQIQTRKSVTFFSPSILPSFHMLSQDHAALHQQELPSRRCLLRRQPASSASVDVARASLPPEPAGTAEAAEALPAGQICCQTFQAAFRTLHATCTETSDQDASRSSRKRFSACSSIDRQKCWLALPREAERLEGLVCLDCGRKGHSCHIKLTVISALPFILPSFHSSVLLPSFHPFILPSCPLPLLQHHISEGDISKCD